MREKKLDGREEKGDDKEEEVIKAKRGAKRVGRGSSKASVR
jgi:hypothetical protein